MSNQSMDTYLQPADPGDCTTTHARGYRGILCATFPEPLYVFPIPQQGMLVIPFAHEKEMVTNEKEPEKARAIRFTSPPQRTPFPVLTAATQEEAVTKSFTHHALPEGKDKESEATDERWPLACEHGFHLGIHYFRFKAGDDTLYVFPPTPKEPETTLFVFVSPPQDEQPVFIAHLIRLDRKSFDVQQEVLEATSLDRLFERFLHFFRGQTIHLFQRQQTRQRVTTGLALLTIIASQVIIASTIWLQGAPLAHDSRERFLLILLVLLCGLGGALVALRPLRMHPRSPNRDIDPPKRHQLLLSGGILLLEAGSLADELQARTGAHVPWLPSTMSLLTWFLLILFLALPLTLGWRLGHYRPFSAYRRTHTYAPGQRFSITVALAQSWLLKRLQQLRGYPDTVGTPHLPASPAPLLLARDYLYTYHPGSSRMAHSSCRIRVFIPEWYALPAPEPPVTLILCSAMPPGDITSSAATIATAIWYREGTPRSLVWVEQWWPTHAPSEFRCVRFRCNQKGILSRPQWFPVPRSTLEAILKEPIEPLEDPTDGKHRSGGEKRSK